jgi:hypothetical protein
MEKLRLAALFPAAALAVLCMLACGGGSSSLTSRQLLSVTVAPASTTANGPVQFVATGHYNAAPYTVTPLPEAKWGVCFNSGPTTAITVTQAGIAQCAAGSVGTYSVWADAPPFDGAPVCNAINACGGGCLVAGTAQLTCK